MGDLKEKNDQIILTIILSIFTGLLVSIAGNIIYDIFFLGEKTISNYDSTSISILIFCFILVEAFLEFLWIEDKFNVTKKNTWKRFIFFIMNKHWLARTSDKLTKIIIGFFKILMWSILIISLFNSENYILVGIIVIFLLIRFLLDKKIISYEKK